MERRDERTTGVDLENLLNSLLNALYEILEDSAEFDENDITSIRNLCQDDPAAIRDLSNFVSGISLYGNIDHLLERHQALFRLFQLSRKVIDVDEVNDLFEYLSREITDDSARGQLIAMRIGAHDDTSPEEEEGYPDEVDDDSKFDSDSSDTSEIIELDEDGLPSLELVHQNLHYNETTFRTEFYKLYVRYLEQLKESILDQDKKNAIARYIEELNNGSKGDNIKDWLPKELKGEVGGLKLLPNFATASISYIPQDDDQAHTKNLRFPPGDGHTEMQILQYVKSKKLAKPKYKDAKKIIIDIHSKLSACKKSDKKLDDPGCHSKLEKFAESYSKDTLEMTIRQTYDQEWPPKRRTKDDKEYTSFSSTLRTKVPKVQEKHYTPKSKGELFVNKNSFIVSGGGSEGVKEIVTVVKNRLTSKAIIDQGVNELGARLENEYIVRDVPHDGNCFFHAIAVQLGIGDAYQQIRAFTMSYMADNQGDFIGIGSVLLGRETFEEYIHRMYSDGQWVGQPEIQALADAFNINIEIITNGDGGNTVIRSANGSETTVVVGYINDMHYVALMPVDNTGIDEVDVEFRQLRVSDEDKGSEESANDDKPEVYFITEIVYDNPLLNNLSLLNSASKLLGFDKALDLSSGLAAELIEEAIDNSNDELILAGLISLCEE